MNKLIHSIFFRIVSLVLIIAFVALDVSWAYSPEYNARNSTLAAPSLLQQNPINEQTNRFQQSIFSQGEIVGSICSIGKYLLEDNLPIKYLDQVMSAELGEAVEGIDLTRVTVKDDIALIPCEIKGKKSIVQIALRDNVASKDLVGQEWLASDKYVIRELPDALNEKRTRVVWLWKNYREGILDVLEGKSPKAPFQIEIHPYHYSQQQPCSNFCEWCTRKTDKIQLKEAHEKGIKPNKLISFINSLRGTGVKFVIISGNSTEPLLYPWIDYFLKSIKSAELGFKLFTNFYYGEKVIDIVTSIATKYDLIRISLDAGAEESYRKTHHPIDKKAFTKIIGNIERLLVQRDAKKSPLRVEITYLLTEDNSSAEELCSIIEWADKTGVDAIRFSVPLKPTHQNKGFDLTEDTADIIKRRITDIASRYGDRRIEIYVRQDEVNQSDKPFTKCYHAQLVPVIGARGRIYPCTSTSIADFHHMGLGDINSDEFNFWSIWRDSSKWQHNCSHCPDCTRFEFDLNKTLGELAAVTTNITDRDERARLIDDYFSDTKERRGDNYTEPSSKADAVNSSNKNIELDIRHGIVAKEATVNASKEQRTLNHSLKDSWLVISELPILQALKERSNKAAGNEYIHVEWVIQGIKSLLAGDYNYLLSKAKNGTTIDTEKKEEFKNVMSKLRAEVEGVVGRDGEKKMILELMPMVHDIGKVGGLEDHWIRGAEMIDAEVFQKIENKGHSIPDSVKRTLILLVKHHFLLGEIYMAANLDNRTEIDLQKAIEYIDALINDVEKEKQDFSFVTTLLMANTLGDVAQGLLPAEVFIRQFNEVIKYKDKTYFMTVRNELKIKLRKFNFPLSLKLERMEDLTPGILEAIKNLEKNIEPERRMSDKALESLLRKDGSMIMLAKDGQTEKILGYIFGLPQKFVPETETSKVIISGESNIGKTLYEMSWQVLPDYQGKGVGSKLRHALRDEARKTGYNFIAAHQVDKFGEEELRQELLNYGQGDEIMKLVRNLPSPCGTEINQQYIVVKLNNDDIVKGKTSEVSDRGVSQARMSRLFEVVQSSVNNERAKLIESGNKLIDSAVAKMGAERTPSVDGNISKEKLSYETRQGIERAISIIETLDSNDLSPETKTTIKQLKKNLDQFEADGAIASIIVLARKAKRENQKLIIGLETDWIPGMNIRGSLQRSAMTALMREIDSIGEVLQSMGLDNVEIIRGNSSDLASKLLDVADKTHTSLHNMIVMASTDTINSASFTLLKNADEANRPFLASIDPTELIKFYEQFGEAIANQLYIRLTQLLYMTLELAAGKQPPQLPIIVSYDSKMRMVIFLPKAEPRDYELIKSSYAAERTALAAA